MRIQKLSANIANQIAAGEVIERPASVVKELLENSLDAKSKQIDIILKFGGLNQIKISDDGIGIFAEDLPLAISAHATSKISSIDDLYNITSMGFRGEALASIASVSKIKISSRPKSAEHAMQLIRENDIEIVPCARSYGSTIDVTDIFYNTPVRKKFLKTEKQEFHAIEDVVKRFALSAPGVGLSLTHNDKLIFSLPAAKCLRTRNQRIKKIFGKKFLEESKSIDIESSGIKLSGLIGRPEISRTQRDRNWIYLNNRVVKDKLLIHAVMQAYQDEIMPGRFPMSVLYLELDPAVVDVNVHPTKHEVRFQNPRLIHDFIVSAISEKLNSLKQECLPSALQDDRFELANITELKKTLYPKTMLLRMPQDGMRIIKILNSSFAFSQLTSSEFYLVNLAAIHNHSSASILKNADLPLIARPLLVPVSYEVESEKYIILEKLKEVFLSFGIQYDFTSLTNIVIRTIPSCLPALDIKKLFSNISLKLINLISNSSKIVEIPGQINVNGDQDLRYSEIIRLLLLSKTFDALQSSSQENDALLDYMQKHCLQAKFSVLLNNALCMGLFENV